MTKTEAYLTELEALLCSAVAAGDELPLRQYLLANSNLPGPRGNLELADAFVRELEAASVGDTEALWRFCLRLAESAGEGPAEFVAFCGVRGIGALGAVGQARFEPAMARLGEHAREERWRLREAVAMALQTLLRRRPEATLVHLRRWVADGDWLAMRAVAAGVAEPPLLAGRPLALAALDLHRAILERLVTGGERRSDAFRALRQGLGYSLSVVVAAAPDDGFAYMRELAASSDKDVQWILRENLKKKRLAKPFAAEVAALQGHA